MKTFALGLRVQLDPETNKLDFASILCADDENRIVTLVQFAMAQNPKIASIMKRAVLNYPEAVEVVSELDPNKPPEANFREIFQHNILPKSRPVPEEAVEALKAFFN